MNRVSTDGLFVAFFFQIGITFKSGVKFRIRFQHIYALIGQSSSAKQVNTWAA